MVRSALFPDELDDSWTPVQISEEWSGFADLFEPLSLAFPSIPRDWYTEVMDPAFRENRRVLYESNEPHRDVA